MKAFDHFVDGSGDAIELTETQMREIVSDDINSEMKTVGWKLHF